jgi:WD40 repeat protein
VRVWSAQNGQMLVILHGHVGAIRRIALSADGRRAVSGGVDGTVRVRDVDRVQQVAATPIPSRMGEARACLARRGSIRSLGTCWPLLDAG